MADIPFGPLHGTSRGREITAHQSGFHEILFTLEENKSRQENLNRPHNIAK